MQWVRAVHIFSLLLWAGGLVALTRMLALSPGDQVKTLGRRLYLRLAAPGAFFVFLTGIWMLHQQQALLRQPFMHAKLGLVGGLFVIDHLAMRGLKGPDRPRRFLALHIITLLLLAGIVILIVVKPFIKAQA
ncbi:MAG: CopD family protein [Bradymonadia bacterium]